MKKLASVMLAFAVLLSCANAFAASPWTEKTTYKEKTLGKLDYGLKNVLGGWTEVFTRPIKYHKDGKSFSKGALVGLYNAVVYTGGGILHVVTFPIPLDVPIPDNGVSFE